MKQGIDPDKISTFCASIITKYLKYSVSMKKEPVSNSHEIHYSLSPSSTNDYNTPVIAISDRGERQLRVFPFLLEGITENFWIYFSITYNCDNKEKKRITQFKGVSLAIFRGTVTDENKEILFRAEWDSVKDINEKQHPHPHWHIHFVKEKLPSKVTEDFEAFLELASPETQGFLDNEYIPKPQKDFNISRFHFAMGASWHPKRNDKHQLDEISLKHWLEYTLRHIKEQLEYATS